MRREAVFALGGHAGVVVADPPVAVFADVWDFACAVGSAAVSIDVHAEMLERDSVRSQGDTGQPGVVRCRDAGDFRAADDIDIHAGSAAERDALGSVQVYAADGDSFAARSRAERGGNACDFRFVDEIIYALLDADCAGGSRRSYACIPKFSCCFINVIDFRSAIPVNRTPQPRLKADAIAAGTNITIVIC